MAVGWADIPERQGPVFHPQDPHLRARNGSMDLEPQCWEDLDREIPGAHLPGNLDEFRVSS